MVVNDVITGIVVFLIGYVLGSIPSAYLVTRLAVRNDIRQMGGGNVGGLNVFREVGIWPAVFVGLIDLGKGAAAVAIALWLLKAPTPFVLLAGLASVIGHNWMVFLRFSGGKGMGAAFGVLIVLLPVYGYPVGLAILLGIILIPFLITRNVALSMAAGLVSLPFITWFGMKSGIGTVTAIVLGIIIGLKFLPTARTAWSKSQNTKEFIFDRRRKRKAE